MQLAASRSQCARSRPLLAPGAASLHLVLVPAAPDPWPVDDDHADRRGKVACPVRLPFVATANRETWWPNVSGRATHRRGRQPAAGHPGPRHRVGGHLVASPAWRNRHAVMFGFRRSSTGQGLPEGHWEPSSRRMPTRTASGSSADCAAGRERSAAIQASSVSPTLVSVLAVMWSRPQNTEGTAPVVASCG